MIATIPHKVQHANTRGWDWYWLWDQRIEDVFDEDGWIEVVW